eukprot:TRINITY_DN3174_c0_g3_i1.p1 TRINITY_DN3174_c0_g3~~TRINITY_DN3174_c0_g3_i1.p1  ORF type:complete len:249 (+),score=-36.40 TRINITY_DN3174_c0_g3_i1:230-976(+)
MQILQYQFCAILFSMSEQFCVYRFTKYIQFDASFQTLHQNQKQQQRLNNYLSKQTIYLVQQIYTYICFLQNLNPNYLIKIMIRTCEFYTKYLFCYIILDNNKQLLVLEVYQSYIFQMFYVQSVYYTELVQQIYIVVNISITKSLLHLTKYYHILLLLRKLNYYQSKKFINRIHYQQQETLEMGCFVEGLFFDGLFIKALIIESYFIDSLVHPQVSSPNIQNHVKLNTIVVKQCIDINILNLQKNLLTL